ncbi:hypothetical protein WA1_03775 [Scytonema hofmannii PCC 7110]|uniref:Uncharacterized protein n=1 Tax=Scytonema hofmannii PCC 7110 TaxID=128403 RepID=A0A139X929_9CYAN|nr:sigma-70 factor domain-containing protein [Scytonema hofmannii]KYC41214.1 hypothetical protein WA1_03775 [Scytonema hofmannii PCC 7110]
MPDRLLHLDDVKNIKKPEQVAAIFQKLGYKTICQLLDVTDLELSKGSTQAVNQVYLIANQGNAELQVLLFKLKPSEWFSLDTVTYRMQAIANNLCQRLSYFLLLCTRDYSQLMLVSPRISFDAQMKLRLKINKCLINTADPSYHDLNRLEKIAAFTLDPQTLHHIQHEALRFRETQKQYEAQDSVRWYLQQISRIKLLNKYSRSSNTSLTKIGRRSESALSVLPNYS